MYITGIEYFKLDLPLSEPYTIAYETVTKAENVILKIFTSEGITGWGCSAPDKEITGETASEVIEAIENQVFPYLKGQNPLSIALHHEGLRKILGKKQSTLAMIDMALYDILARKAGVPMYQILGGYRERIQTSITIGICSIEETLEKAISFKKAGFEIIKLKGGLNLEEDIEKVFLLREKFGKSLVLRFDANQGYSIADAIQFVKSTKPAEIEILEQPTDHKNDFALKQITDEVHIPVMADESLRNLNDAFRLSSGGMMDMANIKIMKVGGITEAFHINSVAKAAGMEVMVGCLDETALGISAGLHFALSRPNVHFADLDGHLDLLNDPFTHLFELK
ncbi:MAG: dipeptide epimerase, partial [Saprospiraceae bacterium]|nr:dipeptide epimerase [Saprospiraceae bacterium]